MGRTTLYSFTEEDSGAPAVRGVPDVVQERVQRLKLLGRGSDRRVTGSVRPGQPECPTSEAPHATASRLRVMAHGTLSPLHHRIVLGLEEGSLSVAPEQGGGAVFQPADQSAFRALVTVCEIRQRDREIVRADVACQPRLVPSGYRREHVAELRPAWPGECHPGSRKKGSALHPCSLRSLIQHCSWHTEGTRQDIAPVASRHDLATLPALYLVTSGVPRRVARQVA